MDNYFDIEIGVSRKVLTALGVWPDLTAKRHFAIYVRFILFMVLSLGFCNVPQTARLLKIKNDFDEILDNISLCNLPVIMAVFKMASIWKNYEGIVHIDYFFLYVSRLHTSKIIRNKKKKKKLRTKL